MSGVIRAIAAHAEITPHAVAIEGTNDERLTYAQLHDRLAAKAHELAAAYPDARAIALRLDHGIEGCVLELALLAARLPVLSLPTFFTTDMTAHALAASGAQAIIENAASPTDCAPVELPAGTARITFTSGSTGTPKGVCLSAAHLDTVSAAVVEAVGAEHAGRHLALLPPGILLETVAGFFPTLLAGGTYVCPQQADVGLGDPFRPDFSAMLAAIVSRRITSLILVPEYLAGLIAAMEATGTRLPGLTLVAVGGARTATTLITRARNLGLPLRQGYGLTECGSVATLQEARCDADGSVGKTLPHMRASLAADGEILLDGPLCLGTIGGDAPAKPFRTGDIGRIDEAGRVWVHGRKSATIVTSFGRNVAPEWIEEALLAQPGITQAVVYGDGLPAPRALLVPARPDSNLAAAVAAANLLLPVYAQVSGWREVAHFTPANGCLTGNGRVRRKAIAERWLEPTFFDELEATTVRERLRFLDVPQVRAGLAGTIPRQAYIDYLTQAFHHVRHTVPLMRAARERLPHRPALVTALDDYIAEEIGHEEWILSDIAAAGGDAFTARWSKPDPATQAMVDYAYRTIENGNPAAFFGMVYVLESVSVALASHGAAAVAANLGLPPEAFTYLTSHGALDQDHLTFFARLMNRLDDAGDKAAIVAMAQEIFGLFGAVFASISLADQRVAA